MPIVAYPHIEIRNGVATIDGTRMKVIHLVLDKRTHGWTPEEIQRQHPFLTLSQIHSALAYYYDHKDEIDQEIEDRLRLETKLMREHGDSPFQAKLSKVKSGSSL